MIRPDVGALGAAGCSVELQRTWQPLADDEPRHANELIADFSDGACTPRLRSHQLPFEEAADLAPFLGRRNQVGLIPLGT